MQSDEEFVREHWVRVSDYMGRGEHIATHYDDECCANERLDQIEQLREEVALQAGRVSACELEAWFSWVRSADGMHESHADYMVRQVRRYFRELRILARLNDALAELKRGMTRPASEREE